MPCNDASPTGPLLSYNCRREMDHLLWQLQKCVTLEVFPPLPPGACIWPQNASQPILPLYSSCTAGKTHFSFSFQTVLSLVSITITFYYKVFWLLLFFFKGVISFCLKNATKRYCYFDFQYLPKSKLTSRNCHSPLFFLKEEPLPQHSWPLVTEFWSDIPAKYNLL